MILILSYNRDVDLSKKLADGKSLIIFSRPHTAGKDNTPYEILSKIMKGLAFQANPFFVEMDKLIRIYHF